MKIHIIGGSGTGKSYLADHLSQVLNIKHFDLDDLKWDNTKNTYGIEMEKEKRDRLLKDILKKDNWIIEGVYYSWCLDCFKNADIIYVLEIPRRVYRYAIIKRFIKRKVGLEKGKKESFKSLCKLLKWTDKFQVNNLQEIREILKKYNEKTVYVRSRREIKEIIDEY